MICEAKFLENMKEQDLLNRLSLGATRTEADFANHIANTVTLAPTNSWIFISDNLNTHQSATLVE